MRSGGPGTNNELLDRGTAIATDDFVGLNTQECMVRKAVVRLRMSIRIAGVLASLSRQKSDFG
jgi:hypothetical protein